MSKFLWQALLVSPTDEIFNQINQYNREGANSQGQVTNVTQLRAKQFRS
jgi:hypothetical protein